jgi:hypothetical protein
MAGWRYSQSPQVQRKAQIFGTGAVLDWWVALQKYGTDNDQ